MKLLERDNCSLTGHHLQGTTLTGAWKHGHPNPFGFNFAHRGSKLWCWEKRVADCCQNEKDWGHRGKTETAVAVTGCPGKSRTPWSLAVLIQNWTHWSLAVTLIQNWTHWLPTVSLIQNWPHWSTLVPLIQNWSHWWDRPSSKAPFLVQNFFARANSQDAIISIHWSSCLWQPEKL